MEPVSNPGCKMDTSLAYEFENLGSGLVMDIVSGKMEAGNNVQQWATSHFKSQQWTLQEFSGGGNYYYIRSYSDPKCVLKADGSANGGNLSIEEYSTKDSAMLFKFAKNPDGTYCIMTRASKDACLVETANASKSNGANVQQWEVTNNDCQKWKTVTFTIDPPESIAGDLNNDGKVNTADIVILQKFLVKKSNEITGLADLNGDKIVNVYDLIILKRKVLK